MTSGWQIWGAYVAAGVALAWNAWNEWRKRSVYACAVSWVDDPESPLEEQRQGLMVFTGQPELHSMAIVTVKNSGNVPIYDVAATISPPDDFIQKSPNRAALAPDATFSLAGIKGGRPLHRPLFDDPEGYYVIRVEHARRPGRRQRSFVGQLGSAPGAEVHLLEERRPSMRDRLADRLRTEKPKDRARTYT